MPFRVLVCGGRTFSDYPFVERVLDSYNRFGNSIEMIIHGDAPGADSLAHRWAVSHNVPVERYRAQWKTLGKAAGRLRNVKMLREGKPNLVVAFPGGVGTRHMTQIAEKAGVRVDEPDYPESPFQRAIRDAVEMKTDVTFR